MSEDLCKTFENIGCKPYQFEPVSSGIIIDKKKSTPETNVHLDHSKLLESAW